METLKDIIARKGDAVSFIRPTDTAQHALEGLAEANVGALLVMNQAGKLVGVISERDLVRHAVTLKQEIFETSVQELMSTNVRTAPVTMSIDQCMALMTAQRIRHLPVYEGERLAGVVSIGDVVKATVEAKDGFIDQLEDYITGSL